MRAKTQNIYTCVSVAGIKQSMLQLHCNNLSLCIIKPIIYPNRRRSDTLFKQYIYRTGDVNRYLMLENLGICSATKNQKKG
ncbi:hypothetical protein A1QO_14155 [Vibrio genomosp. F10 str. ZF-129]|uniref:Uncharacterized protein n=1 Tax=Vibrio genomosp. F10 str. ZF-129 TaxID=1187848 RepID=A0A1E5BAY5_9VIBR|nr:hypothetical protein A1QO_14155 [Vibrio genomosp. F10 str. ZF-129]OEE94430.1 hypothetical protein A1QM_18670 [Vibrio genomosp. F10 str. 9ZC157]